MRFAPWLVCSLFSCIGCNGPSAPPPAASSANAPQVAAPEAQPSAPPSAKVESAPVDAWHDAPVSLTEELQKATTGDAEFAAALYRGAQRGRGNRLISPLSVRIAFSMVAVGARGATAQEMQKALVTGADLDGTARGHAKVLADFARRGRAPATEGMQEWEREIAASRVSTLRVVNRLWGQAGRPFQPGFTAALRDQYAAPLETLDFVKNVEAARTRINGWVADNTEQKITDLLAPGSLQASTRLVLTNAVYFKAAWATPFQAGGSRDEPFFVDGGAAAAVPTMHGGGHVPYLETADASVLQLPYADPTLAMVVVLPKAKNGLPALEAKLRGQDLQRWGEVTSSRLVEYALPRFKFAAGFDDLVETMKGLGMQRAFSASDADFSGMDGTRELYVGAAVHKTFIAVDEKGTEAAAATAVAMTAGAAPLPTKPTVFRADRPFLFFLRDARTGAVLFVGRVTDPRAS